MLSTQIGITQSGIMESDESVQYCGRHLLFYRRLDPFRNQEELVPLIDFVNSQQCRIPWLANRRLVFSLTPDAPGRRAGP